jgi:hypothetical protein
MSIHVVDVSRGVVATGLVCASSACATMRMYWHAAPGIGTDGGLALIVTSLSERIGRIAWHEDPVSRFNMIKTLL